MDFNQFKYLTAFTRWPLPFNYLGITNSKEFSWVKLLQTQTLTASPRRLRAKANWYEKCIACLYLSVQGPCIILQCTYF